MTDAAPADRFRATVRRAWRFASDPTPDPAAIQYARQSLLAATDDVGPAQVPALYATEAERLWRERGCPRCGQRTPHPGLLICAPGGEDRQP